MTPRSFYVFRAPWPGSIGSLSIVRPARSGSVSLEIQHENISSPQTPFSGSIALACTVSGGPNLPSCHLDTPVSGAASAVPVPVILTVTVSPSVAGAAEHKVWNRPSPALASGFLLCLFCSPLFLRGWRIIVRISPLCLLLLAISCGGTAPTTTSTYRVVVTGTDANNRYIGTNLSLDVSVVR